MVRNYSAEKKRENTMRKYKGYITQPVVNNWARRTVIRSVTSLLSGQRVYFRKRENFSRGVLQKIYLQEIDAD